MENKKLNIIKITPEVQKQFNEIMKKAKDLTDREVASITKGLYKIDYGGYKYSKLTL